MKDKFVLPVSHKKVVFFTLGILLAVLSFLCRPFSGLGVQGMHVLGLFGMAVCWWIGGVFADYITALWLMILMAITGTCSASLVFCAFSGSIVWIVIPVLAIGVALGKSGLLLRCVLAILCRFKGGYLSQTFAVLLAGNLINPLIPSQTAKVAISAPIVRMYCEMMGYEKNSREAAGVFSAMWMGFGASGPFFITGTAMCYVMIGVLPEEYQNGYSFLRWLLLAFPWGLVLFAVSFLMICLLYAPKEKVSGKMEFLYQRKAELEKMSRDEWICALTLGGCILMWITENVHGIPAFLVALAGMAVMLSAGVINRKDFCAGIPWDTIVFIGCCSGLGTVFSKVGITDWVGTSFGPFLQPLFSKVWLLIPVSVVLLVLLRYVFVSITATITLYTIVSAPFALAAGINPFIPGFIVLVVSNVVCASYNNSIFMTAVAASGDLVSYKDVKAITAGYALACIAGLLMCIPVWRVVGMF